VEGALIGLLAIGTGHIVGSVPFSNLVAHRVGGTDR
jgi:hypothetical protein